ncbi:transmembrane protein, putative [Medicago truncatula]|uniref:Transmembrane protein, putative n=1 Tax=Medicago truncatula TaxID=3880 RepID=A2Q5Q8_MEDTR|nr:hypothetical protein MtrDRAFT_AC167711g4v2 [Medicago truncatula]AES80823.1 transmembrane protein, putative [Medicago truncatula]
MYKVSEVNIPMGEVVLIVIHSNDTLLVVLVFPLAIWFVEHVGAWFFQVMETRLSLKQCRVHSFVLHVGILEVMLLEMR